MRSRSSLVFALVLVAMTLVSPPAVVAACKLTIKLPTRPQPAPSNPTIILFDVDPHANITATSNGRAVPYRVTAIDRHLRIDIKLDHGTVRIRAESPDGPSVSRTLDVQPMPFSFLDVTTIVDEQRFSIQSSALLYRLDWEDGHVEYSRNGSFALDRDQAHRVVGLFADGHERTLYESASGSPFELTAPSHWPAHLLLALGALLAGRLT